MSLGTKIGWTDATWSPTVGCTKVSPGCRNCYAETLHARLAKMAPYGHDKYNYPFAHVRPWPDHLDKPLHWRKPRRIFVNSMSDLFHEDLDDEYIDRVFAVAMLSPRHRYQILTKRAERMQRWVAEGGRASSVVREASHQATSESWYRLHGITDEKITPPPWPLANVWLGVSIEDQQRADERIPHLLQTPAAVRFLSCEPLLAPINFKLALASRIHWVIVGGESGPVYREMSLTWLRDIVDQCVAAGVPVFVKQDSHRLPGQQGRIPDDLWAFKQFPETT